MKDSGCISFLKGYSSSKASRAAIYRDLLAWGGFDEVFKTSLQVAGGVSATHIFPPENQTL